MNMFVHMSRILGSPVAWILK